jgi:hypothetical protein
MAVTINEVQVNSTVTNTSNSSSETGAAKGAGKGELSIKDKEEIIQECLRRVHELIESMKER